jgi:hypothetical protein
MSTIVHIPGWYSSLESCRCLLPPDCASFSRGLWPPVPPPLVTPELDTPPLDFDFDTTEFTTLSLIFTRPFDMLFLMIKCV